MSSLLSLRPEGCLSDYAFDRRRAGELEPREEDQARTHLAECPRCSSRWAELSREHDGFAQEALPPALSGRTKRRRPRLLAVASGLLATAAAVLLFVRVQKAPDPLADTRTKGGEATFGFYVKHGESVRLGGQAERVEPGDALRFVYTAKTPQHLAILSVDGARHASIYFPSLGPSSAVIAAGTNVALPEATVLDATLGDETLYAVFCSEPFAPEPLRSELSKNPERAPSPAGCVVETLRLSKEANRSP